MTVRPELTGVPETTLWTLHNRAAEARRPGLPAADRVRTLTLSALDRAWMDAVTTDPPTPTIVTAEGLLVYFTREQALGLARDLAARFPGGQLLFDTIPPWFSRRTLRGLDLTPAYRAPAMPWGVRVTDVLALPRAIPRLAGVDDLGLAPGRGVFRGGAVIRTLSAIPVLGARRPGLFRARFTD